MRFGRVRSLVYSIYDGFFYSSMVGYGETYFSAYALFLGANNFQLGILSCLPPFLAAMAQMATPRFVRLIPSRRKLVCLGVGVQMLSLIPLALAYFFPVLTVPLYIALVSVYFIATHVVGPVWNSWMGDLVKPEQRGGYFGRRNRVITLGTFLSMTAAGFILRYFQTTPWPVIGFFIIFGLAAVCRGISLFCLSLKDDPPQDAGAHNMELRVFDFLKNAWRSNNGVLVLYTATINFAVYLSAAYFTPRMLKGLDFDYITYTVVLSGVALCKAVFSPFWGELCDELGNRKILLTTGFMISFTTVPWVFAEDPFMLFFAQCFAGFVWSGYELSTFAFLLDSTEPKERARISSCLHVVSGCAGLLGGLVGAILVSDLFDLPAPYRVAFALSAGVRIVAFFIFAPRLREVRVLSPVRIKDVFLKASGFRTAMGVTSRLIIYPKAKKKTDNKKKAA